MAPGFRRLISRLLLAAVLLPQAQVSFAQTAEDATAGVLKRLHDRGIVVIGYSEDDFPFSYRLNGHPIGYTIDLCLGVVGELDRAVGRHLRVEYLPVAANARLDAVRSGGIDIECSSTTANADLHRVAAFSPIIFVDGTRLLVRRGSKLRGYGDMTGKTLVVIAGTRAKQVMGYLVEQRRLTARTVTVPDADQALAMLHDGRADAIASDDVELHRLVAENKGTGQVSMVGGFLSQEPYAIMFAKDDPPLAGAVGRGFARMAHDGDLFRIYGRWFQRTPPGGPALRLPMSTFLSAVFHLLSDQE